MLKTKEEEITLQVNIHIILEKGYKNKIKGEQQRKNKVLLFVPIF